MADKKELKEKIEKVCAMATELEQLMDEIKDDIGEFPEFLRNDNFIGLVDDIAMSAENLNYETSEFKLPL